MICEGRISVLYGKYLIEFCLEVDGPDLLLQIFDLIVKRHILDDKWKSTE